MTTETAPPKRRVPLWVKVLLGVSLAANLAVVGLVAGTATRVKNAPGGPGAVNHVVPYVAALERDARRALFREMRQKSQSGAVPTRRMRKVAYQDMIALLQNETWDPVAAQAILERQRGETMTTNSALQATWLDAVGALSSEERTAYALRLQEFMDRRGARKKRDKER